MSESRTLAATEQLETVWPFEGEAQQPIRNGASPLPQQEASDNRMREHGNEPPPWLRPFFSLRAQLLFAYCLLLALAVLIASLLSYMQSSRVYIALVAIAAVVAGSILAYVFTTLLLRPLWRVIDASQAIAIGDLEQRDRLILRQPPQDDIDRLAGSLNEMVTRLEKAQELQFASEQRFKRFFSDASHQLRTPLTSIRGFTEILMRGAIDDPKTRQHVLSRMKSEAERMTTLINDLLTLARLDDSHPLKLQYADLIELATDSIKQARTRVNDERIISFILDTDERVGAHVDSERIKQLLFILLDNALKHGSPTPESEITLKLSKRDGQAIIQVIDQGDGIDQEDLEHIFESFYRGRRAAGKPQPAGAGLGLTIAHTIVSAHNGSIKANSESGKGTEFVVMLPCVE